MESIHTKLALYGSKNECARTDNVFSPISEVCDGMVSLVTFTVTYLRIGDVLGISHVAIDLVVCYKRMIRKCK